MSQHDRHEFERIDLAAAQRAAYERGMAERSRILRSMVHAAIVSVRGLFTAPRRHRPKPCVAC